MDPTSRIINYVSLAVGLIFLLIAAWYIYNKMNTTVEQAASKRFIQKMEQNSFVGLEVSESDSSELYGDELVIDESNGM